MLNALYNISYYTDPALFTVELFRLRTILNSHNHIMYRIVLKKPLSYCEMNFAFKALIGLRVGGVGCVECVECSSNDVYSVRFFFRPVVFSNVTLCGNNKQHNVLESSAENLFFFNT
jgi:hypothetical protein